MKFLTLKDVPPEMMKKVKSHAALQGLTMKSFILKAIESYLETGEKK